METDAFKLFSEIYRFCADSHQVVVVALWVCGVTLVIQIFYFARLVRRALGLSGNGGSPTDVLTLGQGRKEFEKHDGASANRQHELCDAITKSLDAHFSALLTEMKTMRKTEDRSLMILRDLRAFMIFNEKPDRKRIIEEENGEG